MKSFLRIAICFLFLFAGVAWAADTRITDLTEDTAPAAGDWVMTVDVSDTTMSAEGTNKKTKASNLTKISGYDELQMVVFDFTTDMATGDGKFYFHIGPQHAGMNLTYCHAENITAGTGTGTDTSDIQIYNVTQTADMLSTKLTIDEDETGSDTAATAYVIDTGNDDVAENDVLRVDVDAVTPTTPPKGLLLTLGFSLP